MPLVVSYNIAITPFKSIFDNTTVSTTLAFDNILRFYGLETSRSTILEFKRDYDCPNYEGRSLRYKQSTFCYVVGQSNLDN
jgi:hypothetical protein